MSKFKTKQQINAKRLLLIGFLTVTVTAFLYLVFFYLCQLHTTIHWLKKTNFKQSHDITRLEFCINNSIIPCDYVNLTEWNKANPDNVFERVEPR